MPESKRLEDARSIAVFCQQPECPGDGPYSNLSSWAEHLYQRHLGEVVEEPLVWYED